MYIFTFKGFKYISKTGATGVIKDEATNINSSLIFLDIVIIILVDGKYTHIPYYWNSELTQLFQDPLRGNSKTVMIRERLILRYISMLGEWE